MSIQANSLTYNNSPGIGDAALVLVTSAGPVLVPWSSVASMLSQYFAAHSTAVDTVSVNVWTLNGGFLNIGGLGQSARLTAIADGGNAALFQFTRYSNDAIMASVRQTKSRGTVNTPLMVQSGDQLGEYSFHSNIGDGVSSITVSVQLIASAISTHDITDGRPSVFKVRQVAPNTFSLADKMVCDPTSGTFIGSGWITLDGGFVPRQTVINSLPSTINTGHIRMVTNDGGASITPVVGDGATWRRFGDFAATSTGNKPLRRTWFVSSAPAAGFTYTVPDGCETLILNHTTLITSGAITMPQSPLDGEELTLLSRAPITTLAMSANTGQTLLGPMTITVSNDHGRWKWINGNAIWYRM